MFLIRKLFSYPVEPEPGSCSGETQTTESFTSTDDNVEMDIETTDCNGEVDSVERREGIITLLDECMAVGTIDQKYKFTKEDYRHLGLRRGMVVSFITRDVQDSADSVAEDLRIVLDLKERLILERAKYKTANFRVIRVEERVVVLARDVSDKEPISVDKALLPSDYPVLEGDWLEIKFEAREFENGDLDTGHAKVLSVSWAGKSELRGTVTKLKQFLCINGTIYFSRDVVKGRSLRLNDSVVVVAIDSDQEESMSYNHRNSDRGESPRTYLFRKRALEVTYMKKSLPENNTLNPEEEGWDEEVNAGSTIEDTQLDTLMKNKNSIHIRPNYRINFGSVQVGATESFTITIDNFSLGPVSLRGICLLNVQDVCTFKFEHDGREESEEFLAIIHPRVPFNVKISCTPTHLGRTKEICVFDFGPQGLIGRWLVVAGVSAEESWIRKQSNGTGGEHWRKRNADMDKAAVALREESNGVIAAPSLVRGAFFIPHRILRYNYPDFLLDIFHSEDAEQLQRRYPIDFTKLTPENYVTRFQVSLWLEEIENKLRRTMYDMSNVIMTPVGENLMFHVPGLKEMYPPVLQGDNIKCTERTVCKDPFKGVIVKILCPEAGEPEVHVKFHESIHRSYNCTTPITKVHFCLGRNVYRRQHFAVNQAMESLKATWLFPKELIAKPRRLKYFEVPEDNVHSPQPMKSGEVRAGKIGKTYVAKDRVDKRMTSMKGSFDSNVQLPPTIEKLKLRWFNGNLNAEQRNAVRGILAGRGRPLPYVIFGPPGTGKTVTVVEAIMQVYFLEPTSRILVTVPSNAGADQIAERLVATNLFKPGEFVRLNGFLRSEMTVSDTIADFCVDGTFLDSVAKHRLIISTVSTAGQFFQLSLNTGHFSHVFVDEAGYCTEPEAMIPCVLTAIDKEGIVVLAGDPEQLGPVLMNDMAINNILLVSFLERIMKTPVYARQEDKFPQTKYDPAVLTKLVRSYRAHPVLLKIPSELFYQDELVSLAGEEAYEFCGKGLQFLPVPDVPLVFHGVKGRCDRDRDSPSWYNLAEASQVVDYVRKLRNHGVSTDDIGIITPYRKQVEKIRSALTYRLLDDDIPKVASVQEFQGGERKVIIISTVRSEYEDILSQKISRMDFLYSRKLFNVAITRAKALLIVIGNPDVLHLNQYWDRLLRYSVDLGVYTGCELPSQLNVRLRAGMKKLEEEVVVPPLVRSEDVEETGGDAPDWEDGYSGETEEPSSLFF